MPNSKIIILTFLFISLLNGCNENKTESVEHEYTAVADIEKRLAIYKEVPLTADLSFLTNNQKEIIKLLIEASKIMDDLFWQQSYFGEKDSLLKNITNEKVRNFVSYNYGPWDRLNNNKTILENIPEKSLGAAFYPVKITKDELQKLDIISENSLYTVIEKTKNNKLISIPYSEKYSSELTRASAILLQAAKLTENEELKHYLTLRAQALITDNYQPSDIAWMDMKSNVIDVVIGAIETYEDKLLGYRTAYESYVLIKDIEWSNKLNKYVQYLPQLQRNLPVTKKYKKEQPNANSDLNAYDVIYYAGHANAGSKTIAINLPNDEEVQLQKGTRRLQLKNAMQAKFDHILLPISKQLIDKSQQHLITFNAFFSNTMFHEVAHGLGIKYTINNKGTVREALKEHASVLEEGKADILGLYMLTQLLEQEVITEGSLEEYYVTFMASIFRSIRFGASSAHGKANMIRFNYFQEQGAFTRNESGIYLVKIPQMKKAVGNLAKLILTLQGDGDYLKVDELVKSHGEIKEVLVKDLIKLEEMNIPVDIVFQQGKEVLGL